MVFVHRVGQFEDQIVQVTALGSVINPLPRHVHHGLRFLPGRRSLCLKTAYLPVGRQVSRVDAASLYFALPSTTRIFGIRPVSERETKATRANDVGWIAQRARTAHRIHEQAASAVLSVPRPVL